ncbi:MAG TPA: MmgE/PrpD family protein [Chloroflexota bacterium]|nr:MmgE/PrpD family protein [Chloroflexota bacterium]
MSASRQPATPGVTVALAEYAARVTFESLPSAVVIAVKRLILDSLGTALAAGTMGDGCRELVDMAVACGGRPQSTILGFDRKGPAPLVALANGGLVHALNYDAGGPGHLGVVALVAPLAAAEYVGGVSGKELIAASATACEITARMSVAAHGADIRGELPWLAGQFLSYVGSAAGAGRALRLSPLQMHSAIALAVMQAAGTRQVVLDGDPPAKAVYGAFPNQGGMQAALLAQLGLRADCAALEGSGGFYAAFLGDSSRAAGIADGLGDRYVLAGVQFKAWPTSGVVAPYVEAALNLRRTHGLSADVVARVEFTGGERMRHWCEPLEERRAPASGATAANSIFFGIANALVHGAVTLERFSPAGLSDPSVRRLMARTEYTVNADPSEHAALRVWTTRGPAVEAPVAASASPVTEAQLVAKFVDCARYAPRPMEADRVQRLVELVLDLEAVADVRSLTERL